MSAVLFLLVFLLVCCVGATAIGLPGNYGMMLLILLFGFATDFAILSPLHIGVLLLLLVLGEAIEFVASFIGLRKEKLGLGTQLLVVGGGIVGGIIGSGVLPLAGSLAGVVLGVFVTAYVLVYRRLRDSGEAQRIALRAALAQMIGTGTKVVIGLLVVTYVIYAVVRKISWEIPPTGIGF